MLRPLLTKKLRELPLESPRPRRKGSHPSRLDPAVTASGVQTGRRPLQEAWWQKKLDAAAKPVPPTRERERARAVNVPEIHAAAGIMSG